MPKPRYTQVSLEATHYYHYQSSFKGLVGSAFKLKQVCQTLGYSRTPGLRACKEFFP